MELPNKLEITICFTLKYAARNQSIEVHEGNTPVVAVWRR